MADSSTRYSQLAPLGVDLRTRLAISAVNFFSPTAYKDNCAAIGKTPDPKTIRPLDGFDFTKFLEATNVLEGPLRYTEQIRLLIDRMAQVGILTEMGTGTNVMMPRQYYCMKERTSLQETGLFWLAPALGEDFLFHLAAPGIVHVTGVNEDGDVCAGTGIVFHPNFILTCAHVINDMTVDKDQSLQGQPCSIVNHHAHDEADVGVIQVE